MRLLGNYGNRVMQKKFWKNKRVFITGHTGFKGGWLSLWLQHMGANVKGFALAPNSTPSLFDIASVGSGMESDIGDIRDYGLLEKSISDFEPEIIFHMAAQPLVRLSYDSPIETYETNVMGTVNLLDICRKQPSIKAIVNITSDKCYENKEWVWGYREDEAMGGYDPYSSSKGCAELVASSFRNSYFKPSNYEDHGVGLVSVRAGNVIGGGDWSLDRLIPDIIDAFQKKYPVEIRSPNAIRPWQHVLEPLSGYLVIAENLYDNGREYSEAWNSGPSDTDAQPVENVVGMLADAWGEGASWFISDGEHPHEANYLKLDCSKAKMRLEWSAKWDLGTTIEKIVAWYKAWLDGEDMHTFTIKEIQAYMNELERN